MSQGFELSDFDLSSGFTTPFQFEQSFPNTQETFHHHNEAIPVSYNNGPYQDQNIQNKQRKGKRFPENNSFHPYLMNFPMKNTRRSETVNLAFAAVKGCIPNVSEDTKLSKIQTLRLAISYMRFLMSCLGDHRFLLLMGDSERKLYKELFERDFLLIEDNKIESTHTNDNVSIGLFLPMLSLGVWIMSPLFLTSFYPTVFG